MYLLCARVQTWALSILNLVPPWGLVWRPYSNTLLRSVVGIRPQTSASYIIATTSWQPGPRTREAPTVSPSLSHVEDHCRSRSLSLTLKLSSHMLGWLFNWFVTSLHKLDRLPIICFFSSTRSLQSFFLKTMLFFVGMPQCSVERFLMHTARYTQVKKDADNIKGINAEFLHSTCAT